METSAAQKAEQFKEDVWRSANDFKSLVQENKVMIFSATYCSYCKVAKVMFNWLWMFLKTLCFQKTLEDHGTQFQTYEVNKEGKEGKRMMSIVEGVMGYRQVQHFIPFNII